jgi:hypothetical protein
MNLQVRSDSSTYELEASYASVSGAQSFSIEDPGEHFRPQVTFPLNRLQSVGIVAPSREIVHGSGQAGNMYRFLGQLVGV